MPLDLPRMEITLLLFIAYFALLAWAMGRRSRVVQGPWLFFLRAFFPNWKFYHAVGRPPRLHVRARLASGEWLPWQRVFPRSPRRWHHLVHNPGVNLALSHQNLMDHLASDINALPEGADVRDCVSYQLVCRLARQAVPAQAAAWQFEVRLDAPLADPDAADAADAADACMLQSPVFPA